MCFLSTSRDGDSTTSLGQPTRWCSRVLCHSGSEAPARAQHPADMATLGAWGWATTCCKDVLQLAGRVLAPRAAAEPGAAGSWLVTNSPGSPCSVSVEFVDNFHSLFKVLHGELKQMLPGITFACR